MDKKCIEDLLKSKGYAVKFTHNKEASFGTNMIKKMQVSDGEIVAHHVVNAEMIDLWRSAVDVYEGKMVNCYLADYMQVKNILFCNKKGVDAVLHSEDFMLSQMKVLNNVFSYLEKFNTLRADPDIILEYVEEIAECKINHHNEL